MSKIALKRRIPYIITLRGMLEPWTLKQGALKKQIALSLYQKDLNNADCIHVTGLMEFQNFRNLGYKNPIAESYQMELILKISFLINQKKNLKRYYFCQGFIKKGN